MKDFSFYLLYMIDISPLNMAANHIVAAQQAAESVDCRVAECKTAPFANPLHDLCRREPFAGHIFSFGHGTEILQEKLLFDGNLFEHFVLAGHGLFLLACQPIAFAGAKGVESLGVQLVILYRPAVVDLPFISTQRKRRLPVGSDNKSILLQVPTNPA